MVCFFFNPFDENTFHKVLAAIRQSVTQVPRSTYLVYVNSRHVKEHSNVFAQDSVQGDDAAEALSDLPRLCTN
jgi:hypothetical protein